MCGKWCGGMKLCPVSFGLALGITGGLVVLFWSLWMIYQGVPAAMAPYHMVPGTVTDGIIHALITFVKGFVFGFVVALIYDFFAGWTARWCKKSDKSCGCDCGSGDKIDKV